MAKPGNTAPVRRRLQCAVPRAERQAAADREFQVRCIVHRQAVLLSQCRCRTERISCVGLVDGKSQSGETFQGEPSFRSSYGFPPFGNKQAIGHFQEPKRRHYGLIAQLDAFQQRFGD